MKPLRASQGERIASRNCVRTDKGLHWAPRDLNHHVSSTRHILYNVKQDNDFCEFPFLYI